MKKIGLIAIALVVALGGLGAGYAMWTDTVTVEGPITTGVVAVHMFDYHEIEPEDDEGEDIDKNWSAWVSSSKAYNCPPFGKFESGSLVVDKDVGYVTIDEIYENDYVKGLMVTLHNAYPYYLAHLTLELENVGTIPVRISAPTITQDPFILIDWAAPVGIQIEPGDYNEFSFYVGVTQHEIYFDPTPDLPDYPDGRWIVDDDTKPMLEQDATLSFNIEWSAVQWNEY